MTHWNKLDHLERCIIQEKIYLNRISILYQITPAFVTHEYWYWLIPHQTKLGDPLIASSQITFLGQEMARYCRDVLHYTSARFYSDLDLSPYRMSRDAVNLDSSIWTYIQYIRKSVDDPWLKWSMGPLEDLKGCTNMVWVTSKHQPLQEIKTLLNM